MILGLFTLMGCADLRDAFSPDNEPKCVVCPEANKHEAKKYGGKAAAKTCGSLV